jgi:hypothetical protein
MRAVTPPPFETSVHPTAQHVAADEQATPVKKL